jgi:D-aspartate ligase
MTDDGLGALVLGVDDIIGLGVVRSLGRRRIPVWVLSRGRSSAATSRFARRLPWPEVDEAEQVASLLDLGRRHRLDRWAIFPSDDEAAALLARHHEALSGCFRLTTPPWEILRWAYDKRLTHQLAADAGVDQPWTRCPRDRAELVTLDCPFPVMLKPAVKVGANSFTRARAWRVDGREELLARYDEACALVSPDLILVQELIPGDGEGQFLCGALCANGNPLVSIATRRTRHYPLDLGRSSAYVETVDRPEIEDATRRLLAALRYTGLAFAEFRHDPRDGRYKVIDVNPRPWVSHTLGRRAGVDFAYLLWRLVQGESVPQVHAQTGVGWVRMLVDLPAVAQAIMRGQLTPGAYLRSLRRPLEFSVFAADDPLPVLMDGLMLVQRAWNRRVAVR